MLEQKDINAISSLIQNRRSTDLVSDNLTKIAIALCVAGIIWIMSGISVMKQDMAVSKSWRVAMTKQMDAFAQYTSVPRFAKSDFESSMRPTLDKIELNVQALDRLAAKVHAHDKEINAILNQLESKDAR